MLWLKGNIKNSIIPLNRVEIEKLIDTMISVGRDPRDMKWNRKNKIKGKVPNRIKTYQWPSKLLKNL